MKRNPKYFIIDVDGTFTDGKNYVSVDGQITKAFGKDDWAGLRLLQKQPICIILIGNQESIDRLIFEKYIQQNTDLSTQVITEFFFDHNSKEQYVRDLGLDNIIYMAAGYDDRSLLKDCLIGIVPATLRPDIVKNANHVTISRGGRGAVLDACIFVKDYLEWEA